MAAFSLPVTDAHSKCNHVIWERESNILFYFEKTNVVTYINVLCFCGSIRSLTMLMGRSALGDPVPSRRTAFLHVPPSLRSTPCQSETGTTAPPCRMEQVTVPLFLCDKSAALLWRVRGLCLQAQSTRQNTKRKHWHSANTQTFRNKTNFLKIFV